MGNHHATLVVLRDRGILIRGPAGAGKSSLALALIASARQREWFARLVADDQVMLARSGARLIGRVPGTIAGLAEVRPLGPRPFVHEPAAVIDLVVDLVPAETVARMQDGFDQMLEGVVLPQLVLPQRNREMGISAVLNFVFGMDCA